MHLCENLEVNNTRLSLRWLLNKNNPGISIAYLISLYNLSMHITLHNSCQLTLLHLLSGQSLQRCGNPIAVLVLSRHSQNLDQFPNHHHFHWKLPILSPQWLSTCFILNGLETKRTKPRSNNLSNIKTKSDIFIWLIFTTFLKIIWEINKSYFQSNLFKLSANL